MTRYVSCFVLALTTLSFVGCGGVPGATATGSVKYAGEPVANGSIILQASDNSGGSAKAQIIDGKYTIGSDAGLTVGTYRVQIHGYKKVASAANAGPGNEGIDDPDLAIIENAGPPIEGDPNLTPYIPSKYNLNTELTVTIAAGENTGKDFDLKAAQETHVQQ